MFDFSAALGLFLGLQFTVLVTGCSSAPVSSISSETSTTTSMGVLTTIRIPTSKSGAQTVTDAGTVETTLSLSCGDGSVGAGEACDDGNKVNGDGCNIDCKPSGEMVWDYRSGLPHDDLFFNVAVAADGRIFAGGAQPGDGFDRWLSRFSSDGDVVWSRTYTEPGGDWVIDVAVSDTLIYAAGSVKTGPNIQAWISGLNLDGELLWSDEVITNFGDAYASGVATTPTGDAFFTGLATGKSGQAEVWTRRYSAAGGVQWEQSQVVTGKPLWPLGPAVSAAADRIVVGYYTAAPPSEMLLAYSPAGGETLFDPAFLQNQGEISGVAQDLYGNIFIAGTDANSSMIVRRFAGDASLRWSKSECAGSTGHSVAVDSTGDIVVIGYGNGENLTNIRLCKYSPEGDLRWGRDIDGGGDDAGYGVAIMADDRIVACGRMFTEDANHDAWLAVFTP